MADILESHFKILLKPTSNTHARPKTPAEAKLPKPSFEATKPGTRLSSKGLDKHPELSHLLPIEPGQNTSLKVRV